MNIVAMLCIVVEAIVTLQIVATNYKCINNIIIIIMFSNRW